MLSVSVADTQKTAEPIAPFARARDGAAAKQRRDRKRKAIRGVRRVILGGAVLAAAIGAALALRPRAVPVDGVRATVGSLTVAVEESGMTRVRDRFLVSAPVAGG